MHDKSIQAYAQDIRNSQQRERQSKPGMPGQGSSTMYQGMEMPGADNFFGVNSRMQMRGGPTANGAGVHNFNSEFILLSARILAKNSALRRNLTWKRSSLMCADLAIVAYCFDNRTTWLNAVTFNWWVYLDYLMLFMMGSFLLYWIDCSLDLVEAKMDDNDADFLASNGEMVVEIEE